MPRHPRSRRAAEAVFPREDGASASTSRNREDIPQFAAPSHEHEYEQTRQQQPQHGSRGTIPSATESLHPAGPNVRVLNLEDVEEEVEDISREEDEGEQEEYEDGMENFEDGLEEDMEQQDGEDDPEQEEEEEEEEEEEDMDPEATEEDARFTSDPIPPNLREISSLASWTVSTHKPGCGVSALRNSSPAFFWQSDGPQPHTLTLHFFKRVSIVRLRVYLDFELDESYTPTKMVFLAGMGGNDLVEFATWQDESPCGWVDIGLDGVGGSFTARKPRRPLLRRRKRKPPANGDGEDADVERMQDDDSISDLTDVKSSDEDYDDEESEVELDPELYEDDIDLDDPSAGNVLKAMVLQMRICENHQNGKDTHVRGLQVFARDERYFTRMRHKQPGRAARHSGAGTVANKFDSSMGDMDHEAGEIAPLAKFEEDDWLQEPEIR